LFIGEKIFFSNNLNKIFSFSDSESSSDSLQLIHPVTNLSLEHIEKSKSLQDLDELRIIFYF
jgi:hypothetical protein